MKKYRVVITLFIIAATLVSITITMSFYAVNQNEQAAFERKRSLITMDTSSRLLSNIKDAETGLRGYLLTGEKNYLEPYWSAHDNINNELKTLRDIIHDRRGETELLNSLQPILEVLLRAFSANVELVSNNHRDEALARLKSGKDKRLMDEIRELIRKFEAREAVLLALREHRFNDTLSALSLVNILTSIMIFLMAILSSWFFFHETHKRILSQKQANKDLEKANFHLTDEVAMRQKAEIELRIAATAFELQTGILVTDADGIILRVNKAFTKITGYSSQEVVGQTPYILSSEKHDKAFYANMWNEVNHKGVWEGDAWNRRKDGTVHPEHLTITTIENDEGFVVNYVASLTDITQRVTAEDEIKHLAFYDHLTDLPNRRLLLDRLHKALAQNTRNGEKGALFFIDLDNFKTINDTLGHDIGDLLLQQVADRLTESVREGDTVARLGGDEFVVLLLRLNDSSIETVAQNAAMRGQKILNNLNRVYTLGKNNYSRYVSPSIGVTVFSNDDQTVDELLKQADIAMYKAKEDGRNRLRFFDPRMQAIVVANASLEIDLRNALQNNQLQLFYQLQTISNQSIGAEALIRWQHPEHGLVMPVQFITLAEETGLIIPIGNWVLKIACEQLKAWSLNRLTEHLTLSINVSAHQFHQPDFIEQVQSIIAKSGLNNLSKLKFELTESVILDNVDDTILKMHVLKKMGIHFSMDDFGTGYSSLSYLTRLPLDQIKIDQSFVQNLGVKHLDNIMVQTIIGMAEDLNLDIIAEGVETEEQRLFLEQHGCHSWQGYLFSKPVPLSEFELLIK
ncbi:MAG: diguanylate cyclase (GGDEF)-like protein/PAS domain S-box-containing protein [Paraglaciecola sp.]|jgi:diguanylate cyclase (GGDEF)-like protein/PAS domain S-box-containing protein